MLIITVHDSVGNTWSNPSVAQNENSAKRDFMTACSQRDTMLGQHPEDFKLYAIGDWLPSLEPGALPVFKAYSTFKFIMQGAKNEQSN